MPNICFQMICFQSDFVIDAVLESILPFGPVVCTEGPVRYWQERGFTTSTDRTNDILHAMLPARNIVRGQFAEKTEMMNAATHLIPKDTTHVWMVDADEVLSPELIQFVLERLDDYDSVEFKPNTFFGGFSDILTGFELEAKWQRVQRWHKGTHWATHRPPTVLAPDGKPYAAHERLCIPVPRFHHYRYVSPAQVKAKIEYYASWGAGVIENWFDRVYLPWVLGDAAQKQKIEDEFDGVHEWLPRRRGACRTEPFRGEHPAVIQKRMPALRERFERELAEVEMRGGIHDSD